MGPINTGHLCSLFPTSYSSYCQQLCSAQPLLELRNAMAGSSSSGGAWSRSEIRLMRSLISRHNNSNDEHKRDIVDVLRERFSHKEEHQVIDMYLDIAVEAMQPALQPEEGSGGDGGDIPQPVPLFPPEISHGGRYWTRHEHRLFIKFAYHLAPHVYRIISSRRLDGMVSLIVDTEPCHTQCRMFLVGLGMLGNGNWRDISILVETRTPLEVSGHAQKFFRRMGGAGRRQLYEPEPWSWNVGYAGSSSSQGSTMNNRAHAWSRFLHHNNLESYSLSGRGNSVHGGMEEASAHENP